VELVEAADEEISDQAIEETSVLTEQDAEAVAQTCSGFVRDEVQVGGYCRRVCPPLRFNSTR
jgi:hypothetical protein